MGNVKDQLLESSSLQKPAKIGCQVTKFQGYEWIQLAYSNRNKFDKNLPRKCVLPMDIKLEIVRCHHDRVLDRLVFYWHRQYQCDTLPQCSKLSKTTLLMCLTTNKLHHQWPTLPMCHTTNDPHYQYDELQMYYVANVPKNATLL